MKKLLSLFHNMDDYVKQSFLMRLLSESELPRVINASVSTYNLLQLWMSGLRVETNLPSRQVRAVGEPSSPVYPEVVIWRPDSPSLNTGQAVLVEAVETENTISSSLEKWKRLASLGIRFNLVIPEGQLALVRQILNNNGISGNVHIQTYKYNPSTTRYTFTEVS
jgi:hypothetical protein